MKRVWKTMGELATYVNGYAFKPEDWSENGAPIIRIQNLTGNMPELHGYEGRLDEKYRVVAGDILISWSASLGVYEWTQEDGWLNQHIFKVVFDKEQLDKTYFKYAASRAIEKSATLVHGSTMKHLTKGVFDAIPVPVYAMENQRRIASILHAMDENIANRKRVLALLDELVKSRFVEMFGDPIVNDQQFPVMQFSEIASSRLGKMLDKKNQTGKCAFPYLANYNVQWFRFDLSSLHEMDFTEADRQEFELRKGDLLVCEGGEVGRCAIWNNELEHCYFQKALHRVRCDTSVILPEYMAYTFFLHSQYNGFEDAISGVSTIAHLPGDRLKKLRVIVPPLPLQQKFAAFVHQVDAAKAAAREEIAALETLRGKMMQEFFG